MFPNCSRLRNRRSRWAPFGCASYGRTRSTPTAPIIRSSWRSGAATKRSTIWNMHLAACFSKCPSAFPASSPLTRGRTRRLSEGPGWLHELKFDGYRMHARLDHGSVRLLTRSGLDWTHKYPSIAEALRAVPVSQAYLDGELCGVRPDGTTSFDMIQAASEPGNAAALVFFLFDLLHLDGEDLLSTPLRDRKARLQRLLTGLGTPLQYSDHQTGRGPEFYA